MFYKYKSILCLNGDLPSYNFFKENHLTIIAADGASNTLRKMGIFPDIIVGDLDSIKNLNKFSNSNIFHMKNKNNTDFEKALIKIKEFDLFPTLVVGITGGEVDHIIYNLSCFIKASLDNDIAFLTCSSEDKYQWGIYLKSYLELNTIINQNISIIPLSESNITTYGLNWNLYNKSISPINFCGIRNFAVGDKVKLIVNNGLILVVINHSGEHPKPGVILS